MKPATGAGNGNEVVPFTSENAREMQARGAERRRENRRLAWERAQCPEWFDPQDDKPLDKRAVKAAFQDLTGLAALKIREALLSDKMYPKDLAHLAALVFDRGLGAVTQKVAVQAGFTEEDQEELRTYTEDQLRELMAEKAAQEGVTIDHDQPDDGADSARIAAPAGQTVVPGVLRDAGGAEGRDDPGAPLPVDRRTSSDC